MIQIDKNQLPNMREDGSVKNTAKYTIAEYEHRGLRLKDLAEKITSQIDSHFILYNYKGSIYTDNEDVIQILKDEYPSGDYPAYSNPTEGFDHDNMNIDWDSLLQLQEDKNYIWIDYHYIPKWYYIYRKLAIQLNQIGTISSDKEEGKQLYDKCFSSQDFRDNNEWIEKFDSEWDVQSLDPIHIFASLNNNKIGHEKRLKRINILFKILDDNFKEEYQDINFNGCPAPNTTKIIGARDNKTQKIVWEYFKDILTNSQGAHIDFSEIQSWYGIDIGAFTIFLFWIDAKNFLPLDKNTIGLLTKNNRLTKFPHDYTEYRLLLNKKDTNLYLLLALVSWDIKKMSKLNKDDTEKLLNYFEGITLQIETSSNLKLISIKPLQGCNKKYLKTLKENELYLFDKAYIITDKKITVDLKKDFSLFDFENLDLNINAVVGKNGTGKSTVVELLFAIIYNISVVKKVNPNIKEMEDVSVEFIFESLFLYKITIDKKILKIYKFQKEDNQYVNPSEINLNEFHLDKLFYTIAVNYSQHSLNSLTMGDWIHSLFHKNDAYQTPIVIEPYREAGNIDINRQEKLIKQRLLNNLLLLEDKDDIKNSPRQLTEFYRAQSLDLSFNLKKIFYKTTDIKQIAGKHIYKNNNIMIKFMSVKDEYITILEKLYKKYSLEYIPNKDLHRDHFDTYSFEDKIHLYILKKLVSIAIRYRKYNQYFDIEEKKFKDIDNYISSINNDNSHIVYKLKQAIYFLKFNTLIAMNEDKQRYTLEDLSNAIEKIKLDNSAENLIINELIPPSFFDIDIILDNDINFNTLSSGEKQKIYSVNSILYHVNNINSVDNTEIKYKNINIILDEIELYFHPELQRNYLSYLRSAITKANTNNILGLNILFVTHSPFILSDIPDTKILFLDKDDNDINAKTIAIEKGFKTFGANIHELLMSGFFMSNSIGEFALKKISNIVMFHSTVMNTKQTNLEDLKKEYQDLKEEFYFIQEHIGEEYISGIIKNHIIDIEKHLEDKSFERKRIDILKKELADLERKINA